MVDKGHEPDSGNEPTYPLTKEQAQQLCGSARELKAVDYRGLAVDNHSKIRKNGPNYEIVGSDEQIEDIRKRLAQGEESFLRHQNPNGRPVGPKHFNHDRIITVGKKSLSGLPRATRNIK